MQKSELNPCCAKPSIQSMDYRYPVFANLDQQVIKVNRICMHCYAHWFGIEGDVKQYTRKEWDAWIESSFSDEVAA